MTKTENVAKLKVESPESEGDEGADAKSALLNFRVCSSVLGIRL